MASATTNTPPNRRQQFNPSSQPRRSKQPQNHHFTFPSNTTTQTDSNSAFFFNQSLVIKFGLNSLVWAKLNNYPWWPCKVVNDTNNEFSKVVGKLKHFRIDIIQYLKKTREFQTIMVRKRSLINSVCYV